MGRVLQLFDRLTNVMSGKGTSADRSTWSRYTFIACDPVQAEAGIVPRGWSGRSSTSRRST
jgi:hypothetical protein